MLITIFIICLAVGIGFAIIQFLSRSHNTHTLTFLPTMAYPFLIAFGGVGLLTKINTGSFLSVIIALVSGAITIGIKSKIIRGRILDKTPKQAALTSNI